MSRLILWAVVALLVSLAPVLAAPPTRAVMLIWDTGDDSQMEAYLRLVQALKGLRAQGRLQGVAGLDSAFKVYDFNQKSHADSLARLKLARRRDAPFLALVSLDRDKVPQKVLWGVRVGDPDQALADLQRQLGLEPETPQPLVTGPPGWSLQGQRWQHSDGLSVAVPSSWTVARPDNGGLDLQDAATGLYVSLFPVTGEAARIETLLSVFSAMRERFPGLSFAGPKVEVEGPLELSSQDAAPGSCPSAFLRVGSVSRGQKSLVFVALVSDPQRASDGQAQFLQLVRSTRLASR